ncbi:hypothetical protein E2C01_093425 [Portunus trituberculatus]|uniref:Uncharacterized protein n=1 Tax=Portunus trituberculatus TaxID=210409 RepID=A0A5B7JTZ1_PORTR|nr:hypothetical protein [Portunus trituberculatus]
MALAVMVVVVVVVVTGWLAGWLNSVAYLEAFITALHLLCDHLHKYYISQTMWPLPPAGTLRHRS